MTIVVKLGSSIVVDERGEPRADVLGEMADEIAALHQQGRRPVIVTSGAIARGLGVRGVPRPRAIDELQAASAIGQGKLYRFWDDLLAARGVPSAQVLLTFFEMTARVHYLNVRQTLARLVDWNVVPVINENDTTTTDEISFGDNDFLSAQVAILLSAERLVLLTDAGGLYTGDPRLDPDAALVGEVTDFAVLQAFAIGDSSGTAGTGGMRSKVVAAEMATAAGIPVTIAGGLEPGVIGRAANGDAVGTRFPARPQRVSSFKLWLRYAKPSRGVLRVDAGAARALRESGTSLLPVGIVAVQGAFEAGDAVEVEHDGTPVGKGICNYSAEEVRQILGRHSADVRTLLPRASDEAIHRDYFVLT